MKRTLALLLALSPLACGGLTETTPVDAASVETVQTVDTETTSGDTSRLMSCGPGAITIAADCAILTNWKCQIPTELWRVPCVVPDLHRLLVASCDLCTMAEQLADAPAQ